MGRPKESCASKALGVLAKKMFPQETDGKKVNDELRDIVDGESDGGGSSD